MMRGMPTIHPFIASRLATTNAVILLATAAQAQPAALTERAALPGFAIDGTEVPIAQFDRFVQATGTVTEADRSGGDFEYVGGWKRRPGWTWRTPDGVPPASKQLPAVHLTHAEAAAYCRWAGARLPTAAEWQAADFPAVYIGFRCAQERL